MSKRRKYDIKNKRSMIIIVIVSVLVVAVFSLFIYKYSKTSKIEYLIESGSVLQDVDRNYINIDDDATLKIRWNNDYYLKYNGQKITLGKKVIAYNTITGGMKLYGDYYEISEEGKVFEHHNETVLENTTDSKFYKIDDREYLLVSSKMYSDDYSIEASNYLLVELDRGGNAKLSNDKINLKTISPTTLVTDKYAFDINNEILKFGSLEIDLKKIIGSTNEYKEEKENESSNDAPVVNAPVQNVPNAGTGNAGTGNNSGGTNMDGVINNNENIGGAPADIEDLLDKVKMTSVIRIVEGLTSIDVDYVIYDPYNEYGSVYVEVISPTRIETISLAKNETHLTLNNLSANTDYKLNFIYTTLSVDEETGEEEYVPYTFEEFNLRTKLPEYSVSVHKISDVSKKLTYKVNLHKGFKIDAVNVLMTFEYKKVDPVTGLESIEIAPFSVPDTIVIDDASASSVFGVFPIADYSIEPDTIIKLTVKSVMIDDYELDINSSYTFRFGR